LKERERERDVKKISYFFDFAILYPVVSCSLPVTRFEALILGL
jgi:hypothetical protein